MKQQFVFDPTFDEPSTDSSVMTTRVRPRRSTRSFSSQPRSSQSLSSRGRRRVAERGASVICSTRSSTVFSTKRHKQRLRRSDGDTAGQAAVELALVLPLLAIFTVLIAQFSIVARDQLALWQSTREIARDVALAIDPTPRPNTAGPKTPKSPCRRSRHRQGRAADTTHARGLRLSAANDHAACTCEHGSRATSSVLTGCCRWRVPCTRAVTAR